MNDDDIDPNEEFICCWCQKEVNERVICCSPECYEELQKDIERIK